MHQFLNVRRRRVMRRTDRAGGEGGFTLVEVMASLVVFALIASAVLAAILSSLSSGKGSRARVTAASLVARELEMTRDRFVSSQAGPKSIQQGLVVNPNPLSGVAGTPQVIDGVSYRLERVSAWQSQGASAGPCDGGSSGQLAYLRVTVTATWSGNVKSKPVTATTLLTPPPGTFATSAGHVKVKVVDRNGAPAAGLPVTLSGIGTQATAADGCAFFAYVPPATYTVSVSSPGRVDTLWNPVASQNVTVTSNAVQSVTFSYDRSASLSLTLSPPSGTGLAPANVPITLGNGALLPSGSRSVIGTGAARTIANLWPYANGLQTWLGDCLDADPQGADSGTPFWPGAARSAPLATNPGILSTGIVLGGLVRVTVLGTASLPVPGASVVAVHPADNGCPGPVADPVSGGTVGSALTLPTPTDLTGGSTALLPYGLWTFKVVGRSPAVAWPSNVAVDPRAPGLTNVFVQVS